MKNIISKFCALVTALLMVSPAYAQLGSQSFANVDFSDDIVTDAEMDAAETTFSNPGILPDNPLYFFKRVAENIRLVLSFDPTEKAKLHLEFAKTRLAEAKNLAENNDIGGAEKTIGDFNKELDALRDAPKGIGADVSAMVKETGVLEKSVLVLQLVSDKVPEEAKPSIEAAINNSIEKKVEIEMEVEKDDEKSKATFEKKLKKEIERSESIRQQSSEIKKKTRESGKSESESDEDKEKRCIQVMTPAMSVETGECKEFPTPCDVPAGWKRTEECDDDAESRVDGSKAAATATTGTNTAAGIAAAISTTVPTTLPTTVSTARRVVSGESRRTTTTETGNSEDDEEEDDDD